MFFVYDENIPYKISKILNEIKDINNDKLEIHSVYDLSLIGEKDIILFKKLKDFSKGKKCIFITADRMILKHALEIETLKYNNLIAFICPPSFSNKSGFDRILYLLNAWKIIFEVAKKSKPKDVYLLPAKSCFSFTEKEIKKK